MGGGSGVYGSGRFPPDVDIAGGSGAAGSILYRLPINAPGVFISGPRFIGCTPIFRFMFKGKFIYPGSLLDRKSWLLPSKYPGGDIGPANETAGFKLDCGDILYPLNGTIMLLYSEE